MLSCEICKKLKEAGFPQPTFEESLNRRGDYFADDEPGESVYGPTLSELIEACGDGFKGLFAPILGTIQADWVAFKEFGLIRDIDKVKMITNWEFWEGETPEEAVAKLYLALNEKK